MKFEELTTEQKEAFAKEAQDALASVGGVSFFLTILEDVKSTKPAALISKDMSFHYAHGRITWNKVVYQDRYNYMREVVRERRFEEFFVPEKGHKNHKNILNLVRLLKPLHFRVIPSKSEHGAGFEFDAFTMIDDKQAKINWLFLAIFFLPTEYTKQALEYTL